MPAFADEQVSKLLAATGQEAYFRSDGFESLCDTAFQEVDTDSQGFLMGEPLHQALLKALPGAFSTSIKHESHDEKAELERTMFELVTCFHLISRDYHHGVERPLFPAFARFCLAWRTYHYFATPLVKKGAQEEASTKPFAGGPLDEPIPVTALTPRGKSGAAAPGGGGSTHGLEHNTHGHGHKHADGGPVDDKRGVDCIVLCGPNYAMRERLVPHLLMSHQEDLDLPWIDAAQSSGDPALDDSQHCRMVGDAAYDAAEAGGEFLFHFSADGPDTVAKETGLPRLGVRYEAVRSLRNEGRLALVLPMHAMAAAKIAKRVRNLGDMKAAYVYLAVPTEAPVSEDYAGAMLSVFESRATDWEDEKAMATDFADVHGDKWTLSLGSELLYEEVFTKLSKLIKEEMSKIQREMKERRARAAKKHAAWAENKMGGTSAVHRLDAVTLYEAIVSEDEKMSSIRVDVEELTWLYNAFITSAAGGTADYFKHVGGDDDTEAAGKAVSKETFCEIVGKYSYTEQWGRSALDLEGFTKAVEEACQAMRLPVEYLVSPLLWLRTGILCLPDGEYTRMLGLTGMDAPTRARLKMSGMLEDDFTQLCSRLNLYDPKDFKLTKELSRTIFHKVTREKRQALPDGGEVKHVRAGSGGDQSLSPVVFVRHHTGSVLMLHDLDRVLAALWTAARVSPFVVVTRMHRAQKGVAAKDL